MDNTITICGNVVRPPELKYGSSGTAICRISVAVSRKNKNGEESTSFFDVTSFNSLAENLSNSVTKGTRVIVSGRLEQSTWQNEKGENRSRIEILADDVAVSVRWNVVDVKESYHKKPKTEPQDDAEYAF
jgi:single-strand DNA-binding protein